MNPRVLFPLAASGVFMAANMSAVFTHTGGIFVARDVEDEEAVGLAVVSRERGNMAADLLFERLAQIIDDHEMAWFAKVGADELAELVDRTVRRVMDFRPDRLRGEDGADLVEGHALPRQGLARKNCVRPLAQHIVLGEGAVRLVFGNRQRGQPKRVQNHDEARDAAMATDRRLPATRLPIGS